MSIINYPDATTVAAGAMPAADKVKLNALPTGGELATSLAAKAAQSALDTVYGVASGAASAAASAQSTANAAGSLAASKATLPIEPSDVTDLVDNLDGVYANLNDHQDQIDTVNNLASGKADAAYFYSDGGQAIVYTNSQSEALRTSSGSDAPLMPLGIDLQGSSIQNVNIVTTDSIYAATMSAAAISSISGQPVFDLSNDDGSAVLGGDFFVNGYALRFTGSGKVTNLNLPEYETNGDALSDGRDVGECYRTSAGVMCLVF